jgi:hypothetical protein
MTTVVHSEAQHAANYLQCCVLRQCVREVNALSDVTPSPLLVHAGMRQSDIVELLADNIVKDLVASCAVEVEELFNDYAEKLLKGV